MGSYVLGATSVTATRVMLTAVGRVSVWTDAPASPTQGLKVIGREARRP